MTESSEGRSADPLQFHSHDPNPSPPSDDPRFKISLPDGSELLIDGQDFRRFSRSSVANCFIISTGHGTTGPFEFSGVALSDLIEDLIGPEQEWSQIEVVSNDGFGTRIPEIELKGGDRSQAILIADTIDGSPMTRDQGLYRLVVPGELDDALRQVKWIGRVNIR